LAEKSANAEVEFDDRQAQFICDSVALNSELTIELYKEPEMALGGGFSTTNLDQITGEGT
jgi:hypothetical protein